MAPRTHNFNAGPAVLPRGVLQSVQRNLLDTEGLGLSVMEMSHRSPEFVAICEEAMATIARLYELPDTHEVMFLQGGASMQFAMFPMNVGGGGAYINTGTWSTKALGEAKLVGEATEVWSGEASGFNCVPEPGASFELGAARYLHYTSNNTIYGTQFSEAPTPYAPLVADMSSDFLAYPVDVSTHACIYAGAQKNAGPSGVTVLLIDKEISRTFAGDPNTPKYFRYATHAAKGSMFNTPNTFGIYVLREVARWVEAQGGLQAMAQRNADKANLLYETIDGSSAFEGHAELGSRSHMNVTFRMESPEREAAFLERAKAQNMIGLRGHRSVGGLRASIYNACPLDSIQALAKLMASV